MGKIFQKIDSEKQLVNAKALEKIPLKLNAVVFVVNLFKLSMFLF